MNCIYMENTYEGILNTHFEHMLILNKCFCFCAHNLALSLEIGSQPSIFMLFPSCILFLFHLNTFTYITLKIYFLI